MLQFRDGPPSSPPLPRGLLGVKLNWSTTINASASVSKPQDSRILAGQGSWIIVFPEPGARSSQKQIACDASLYLKDKLLYDVGKIGYENSICNSSCQPVQCQPPRRTKTHEPKNSPLRNLSTTWFYSMTMTTATTMLLRCCNPFSIFQLRKPSTTPWKLI